MGHKITPVVVGLLEANCYIVEADNGDVAVIDPGDDADKILSRLKDKTKVRYIFATHAHVDHVTGLPEVKSACQSAKVFISKKDTGFTKTMKGKLLGVLSEVTIPPIKVKSGNLTDGEEFPFGNEKFKVLSTPGHTPGSICLLLGNDLFTGDTLFYGTLGTTEFPGGSRSKLRKTRKKLGKLPDEVTVYPGHLKTTTIGVEKEAGIL